MYPSDESRLASVAENRIKDSIDIIIRFCNTDSGQTFSPALVFSDRASGRA